MKKNIQIDIKELISNESTHLERVDLVYQILFKDMTKKERKDILKDIKQKQSKQKNDMEYKFIKKYGSDIEVQINNDIVLFQQGEETDGIEYYHCHFMNGYVDNKIKYTAIGMYLKGSEDFEDLTEIELK